MIRDIILSTLQTYELLQGFITYLITNKIKLLQNDSQFIK